MPEIENNRQSSLRVLRERALFLREKANRLDSLVELLEKSSIEGSDNSDAEYALWEIVIESRF